MNASFDLKKPMIVIVGNWNPAVFSPQWVTQYLYDIPIGSEVELLQVFDENTGVRQNNPFITFYEGIGINVSQNRLELFSSDVTDDDMDKISQIAVRILELLPHTPVGSFGINFSIRLTDDTENFDDKLHCQDKIEQFHSIISRKVRYEIKQDEIITLNLELVSSSTEETGLDFNFHHSFKVSGSNLAEQIKIRPISDLLNTAKEICETRYDINVADTCLVFQGGQERQ